MVKWTEEKRGVNLETVRVRIRKQRIKVFSKEDLFLFMRYRFISFFFLHVASVQDAKISAPADDGVEEGSGEYDPAATEMSGDRGELEDGECSGIWDEAVSDSVDEEDACSSSVKRRRLV
jgi:hypothetical protein